MASLDCRAAYVSAPVQRSDSSGVKIGPNGFKNVTTVLRLVAFISYFGDLRHTKPQEHSVRCAFCWYVTYVVNLFCIDQFDLECTLLHLEA